MKRFLFGFAAIVALSGCGSAAGDLCQESTKCRGGNDKDEAACAAEVDGAAAVAAAYGCSDQFDALLTCYVEKSKCVSQGDQKEFTTFDQDSGEDRCQTPQRNYEDCQRGASAFDD
jgi:hypothetical protein